MSLHPLNLVLVLWLPCDNGTLLNMVQLEAWKVLGFWGLLSLAAFKNPIATTMWISWAAFIALIICCVLCLAAQLCLLGNPWTVAHQAPLSMWILQVRIQEWMFMLSSRGSSQPRVQTQVSCIAGRCFTIWATRLTTAKQGGYMWLLADNTCVRETRLSKTEE